MGLVGIIIIWRVKELGVDVLAFVNDLNNFESLIQSGIWLGMFLSESKLISSHPCSPNARYCQFNAIFFSILLFFYKAVIF